MEYLGIPFSVKNVPCLQPEFLRFATRICDKSGMHTTPPLGSQFLSL